MKIAAPKIEVVPIEKLKPSAKNPRKNHALDELERSISKFGYVSPIIAQAKTYRVLAGHGRLKVLKRGGVKQVPVVVVKMTNKQADLYTIADNRLGELSKFDEKLLVEQLQGLDADALLSVGFSEADLQEMVAKEIEDRELKDLDVKPPPKMTWVLVGIETVRFGEASAIVEELARIQGAIVESTSNDGK